ncbi:toprim domain-containing protein [Rubellimicrobium mesophilum]|nr:toprim domain-containing protein [Rubellimicrobium mesophilum]
MDQAIPNTADIYGNDPVHQAHETNAVAGPSEADLTPPGEFVVVVEPPEGVFAPVVVAASVESALVLASANLLPGSARILAPRSVEGLAAVHLPEPCQKRGVPPQRPGRVVFAPDGSPESRQAAYQAAHRAQAAGWTVDFLPAPEGSQWTDVLGGSASPPEEDLARIRDLWTRPPSSDLPEEVSGLTDDIDNRPV